MYVFVYCIICAVHTCLMSAPLKHFQDKNGRAHLLLSSEHPNSEMKKEHTKESKMLL